MPTNLFASFFALRQPEPPEGRAAFVLGQSSGGGDGLNFAVGTEVFQFSTNQIRSPQRPSGILGMWVDATNLTTGKNLIIQVGAQTFIFAGGGGTTPSQGYVPITTAMPATFKITSGGGTGQITLILYNYNPLFTGSVATASQSSVGGGGGASGSGGGGGVSGGSFGGGLRGPTLEQGPQV